MSEVVSTGGCGVKHQDDQTTSPALPPWLLPALLCQSGFNNVRNRCQSWFGLQSLICGLETWLGLEKTLTGETLKRLKLSALLWAGPPTHWSAGARLETTAHATRLPRRLSVHPSSSGVVWRETFPVFHLSSSGSGTKVLSSKPARMCINLSRHRCKDRIIHSWCPIRSFSFMVTVRKWQRKGAALFWAFPLLFAISSSICLKNVITSSS